MIITDQFDPSQVAQPDYKLITREISFEEVFLRIDTLQEDIIFGDTLGRSHQQYP